MLLSTTLLALNLFIPPLPATTGALSEPAVASRPGGSPSIRIAGKGSGAISAAEWDQVKDVDLVGCVAGARIVDLHLCIKDCKGKDAGYRTKSATVTDGMRGMIKNLPQGTPFTITVAVSDGNGKTWEVPPAHFIWKG
ncbi:MAG: hypothetical protein R2811_07950 [Flavobacteriales bacterium]